MDNTKKIAFVLYPGLTPLDIVGPLQVMNTLQIFVPHWESVVVGERMEAMETDAGVLMTPEATFEEVPDPAIIVVPGGIAPTIRQMGNPVLREYLLAVSERAEVVASVCTGSMILAAAGLLEGRKATTHWGFASLLERLGATYVPERWVEDGDILTAAGVSAGIDMALQLVSRITDEGTARFVQLGVEYDPQPPFGGIDWASVDREMFAERFRADVREQLADSPDLRDRLLGVEGAG
ncbi:MAG: DJ-1/PfpI family protein [Actinomycetota bacterium]